MPLQLTPEQFHTLQSAQPISPAMARRLQAILLLAEGVSVPEVARQHQVSPRSVYTWRRLFLRQGSDGLADHPHPGRPLSVDATYIACLEAALDPNSPKPEGGWRIDALQQHLFEQTDQRLSTGRLYALLHKLSYVRELFIIQDRGRRVYASRGWTKGEPGERGRRIEVLDLDQYRRPVDPFEAARRGRDKHAQRS